MNEGFSRSGGWASTGFDLLYLLYLLDTAFISKRKRGPFNFVCHEGLQGRLSSQHSRLPRWHGLRHWEAAPGPCRSQNRRPAGELTLILHDKGKVPSQCFRVKRILEVNPKNGKSAGRDS